MKIADIITNLNNNKNVFESMFKSIQKEQIYWKPNEQKWSILEIACHLFDEEKEDFRQRIDFTLNKPDETWPPIDPQSWVKSRKYADKDFEETVNAFLQERVKSVFWLKKIQNVNWENSYLHPSVGELSAKALLTNWLAHDLLHIRQITAMNYMYLKEKSLPYKLDYAGNW